MNFQQAFDELKQGRAITRHGWEDKNFLKLNKEGEVKNFILESKSYAYDESIILSNEWMDKNSLSDSSMNWLEAIDALKMGANLQLPGWGGWICLDKSSNEIIYQSYIEHPFQPTFTCFTAQDWMVL